MEWNTGAYWYAQENKAKQVIGKFKDIHPRVHSKQEMKMAQTALFIRMEVKVFLS